MSRPISSTVLSSMMAQETSEGFVVLLEITHTDILTPILISSTRENFLSNGKTYLACQFLISLPDDEPESIPGIELQVQNVDRAIVAGARAVTPGSDPPLLVMSVVTLSLPDTVEVGPLTFSLSSVNYDRQVVTGNAGYDRILDELFPPTLMLPTNFAGMH